MPQPRISIQPVPEQTSQPVPLQVWQVTSTSAEGSVNGKKLGRRRISTSGENSRRRKASERPLEMADGDPLGGGASQSPRGSPSLCSRGRCSPSFGGCSPRTVEIRLRPSFFPFTESAELDATCQTCTGVRVPALCGTGWMEMLGCGMVDRACSPTYVSIRKFTPVLPSAWGWNGWP